MDSQLIDSVQSLVSDIAANESEIQILRAENVQLKDKLQIASEENSTLRADIETKNKALHSLLTELGHLNKQRLEYIDGVGQHFLVQTDAVELKYEMEILHSKIRNLARELVVQKSENERLRRINQNMQSGTITRK